MTDSCWRMAETQYCKAAILQLKKFLKYFILMSSYIFKSNFQHNDNKSMLRKHHTEIVDLCLPIVSSTVLGHQAKYTL